jgi:hypothetical protein
MPLKRSCPALPALLFVSGCSLLTALHAQSSSSSAPRPGPGPTFTVNQRDLPATPTLIEYGDMRFTNPDNKDVANPQARKLLVDKIASEHPDAIQLSGDVPYAGNHPADYAVYVTETAAWRAEKLRVYPALGNHELAGSDKAADVENWWKAFPELRGMRWYSVALGKRVYLLNIDSNSDLTSGSDQRKWIENQVSHLDKSVDFVMIAVHHPPVADIQTRLQVDHNPRPNEISLRDYLAEVAPKTHARFVIVAGHIHNYERFEQAGVTYFVSGGGGAKPYEVERTPQDLYQTSDFPNFHYIKFTLDGKHLKGTMYRLADPAADHPAWQAKDSFVITAK